MDCNPEKRPSAAQLCVALTATIAATPKDACLPPIPDDVWIDS